VRKLIDHLEEDRPLYPDIGALTKAVSTGKILFEVEGAVGQLK